MIETEGTLTLIQALGALFWMLATILAIVLSILRRRVVVGCSSSTTGRRASKYSDFS
jgi:hypothetical protein